MSSIEHANPCSSSAHVQHAAAMHSDIAVVDANGRLFSWNWAADGLVPHPQEGVLRLQGRYITHLSASTLRGTVLSTSAVQREGGVVLLSTWSDDVLHRFCAAETNTSVMEAPEVSPAFLHFPLHHHAAGDAVWPMPALATVDPSGLACSCNLTIRGFAWSAACSVRLLRRRRARHFGGVFAKTRLWLSKNLPCKSGCLSRGRSNQLVLFASRTLTVEFASAVSPAPAVESGHRTMLNSPYSRPSLPSVGHTAFALRCLRIFFRATL